MFVRLYLINVNTDELIGPKFIMKTHMTSGNWFLDAQNYKKLSLKDFDVSKIVKNQENIYKIPELFTYF